MAAASTEQALIPKPENGVVCYHVEVTDENKANAEVFKEQANEFFKSILILIVVRSIHNDNSY